MTALLELADRFENGDMTIKHNELNDALGGPFIELKGLADELSNLQTVSTFEDEFLPGNFDRKVSYNSYEECWNAMLWDAEGNKFEATADDERHARMAAGLRCLNFARSSDEPSNRT